VSTKHRRLCSIFAGLIAAIVVLGLSMHHLGIEGLKGLMAMSILGLALVGVGVWGAVLAGVVTGFVVYGGIWFVQEAFDLQPPGPAR
jgi:hypothetical protein